MMPKFQNYIHKLDLKKFVERMLILSVHFQLSVDVQSAIGREAVARSDVLDACKDERHLIKRLSTIICYNS